MSANVRIFASTAKLTNVVPELVLIVFVRDHAVLSIWYVPLLGQLLPDAVKMLEYPAGQVGAVTGELRAPFIFGTHSRALLEVAWMMTVGG